LQSEDDYFHRVISAHNANEYELVSKSMELWGYDARTLAAGICVQALFGRHRHRNAYSFLTPVRPILRYGFINKTMVVREVWWAQGSPGVEERDSGKAACIRLSWHSKEIV
jgi:hypothetical protein